MRCAGGRRVQELAVSPLKNNLATEINNKRKRCQYIYGLQFRQQKFPPHNYHCSVTPLDTLYRKLL
jgi:hypothetical protein